MMMVFKRLFFLWAFCGICMGGLPLAAGAEYLQNGNFEDYTDIEGTSGAFSNSNSFYFYQGPTTAGYISVATMDHWTYAKNFPDDGTMGGFGLTSSVKGTTPYLPYPADDSFALVLKRAGTVSQNLSGLEAGKNYLVLYEVDARHQSSTVSYSVSLGAESVTSLKAIPTKTLAGRTAYASNWLEFTADSASPTLSLANSESGDKTLLMDKVRVVKAADYRGWLPSSRWYNDDTTGISALKNTYTHALNLGSPTNVTINGVEFLGVTTAANTAAAGCVVDSSFKTSSISLSSGIMGNSSGLANKSFFNNSQISLTGLIPGMAYRTTLFSGYVDTNQTAAFHANGDSMSFQLTDFVGYRPAVSGGLLTWQGNASDTGTIAITYDNPEWRLYAVTNSAVPSDNVMMATGFGTLNHLSSTTAVGQKWITPIVFPKPTRGKLVEMVRQ